jgi:tetratricopeptide (TPR) repeat protein
VSDLSQLKLTDNDPGLRNERTRELILAGLSLQDRRTMTDMERALECFKKAATIEPRSALAYSWLAQMQAGRVHLNANPTYLSAAEESASIALRLNPEMGEAHRARALVLYLKGDFSGAIEELFVAYELGDVQPAIANLAANAFKMLGHPEKALAWFGIAAQGPLRPGQNDSMVGDCWADLGDDVRAIKAYNRASELFPYLPEGWMGLCRVALLQKDFAQARKMASENWPRYRDFVYSEELEAQVEFFSRNFPEAKKLYQDLATKDPDGGGSFYGAISYQSALGRLQILARNERKGRATLQSALKVDINVLNAAPRHPDILYRVSAIESSLGKIDSSFAHLREAFTAGWLDYRSLELDPRFDALRDDERFKNILDAMAARVASLRRTAPTEQIKTRNTK